MPALIRAAAIHPPPERGRGILAYNRLKYGRVRKLMISWQNAIMIPIIMIL